MTSPISFSIAHSASNDKYDCCLIGRIPFFDAPLVIEGPAAIQVVRAMLGPTAGTEAPLGTIRGDFGLSSRLNLVHASDSPESAAREIEFLFQPSELLDYELANGRWVVPPS